MLKRKMLFFLMEWKASHKRRCLLINGARQVGKSFIIDGNVGQAGKKVTLPLYLAMFLHS